ncbi:hypothetical protein [Enterococcus sp. LJL51]|uniref:hypothetical protein n=1 Tax=Enterococcus sp. LJL51 TaxID=3416656 RepID=UPI003CEFA773
MDYLIDSYAPYFADSGILEKGWQFLNFLFVDAPFFILRLVSSFFLICEDLLDQSSFFIDKQAEAYTTSVNILRGLGGTSIAKGSLLALVVLISAYYLLFNFFANQRRFSKVLLHYLAVMSLFVFWFGSINFSTDEGKGTKSGALFLVESVTSISNGIKGKVDNATSSLAGNGSSSKLFDATVKQTFYYVNTGSLDGKLPNGEKLDDKKMLMPIGLDEKEKKDFIKKRTDYVNEISKDNPYMVQSGDKMMEKTFAIIVGGTNLGITGTPVLYVNAMVTVVQIIVNLLIIIFPVILFASFFPKCQMILFKFLKMLMGLLFVPVIFGVFLAVYFWINSLIDQAFMGVISKVDNTLIAVLSGGISVLAITIILVIIKVVFLKKLWKNRYKILSYFSDGQLEMPAVEKLVNEKTTEMKERAGEVGMGAVQVAAGVYTGNMAMVANGASSIAPKADKAINLGKEHFMDEDNSFVGFKEGVKNWMSGNDDESKNKENDSTVPDTSFDEKTDILEEKESETTDNSLIDKGVVLGVDDEEKVVKALKELSENTDMEELRVHVENLEDLANKDEQVFFDNNDETILNFSNQQAYNNEYKELDNIFDNTISSEEI